MRKLPVPSSSSSSGALDLFFDLSTTTTSSSSSLSSVSVLFLHGLLGNYQNFRVITKLLLEHWQKSNNQQPLKVFSLDLRNHGRSPHSSDMSYSAQVSDLVSFMNQQELSKAIVVGHSMGGKLAMCLALHHPNRVQKLVSIDAGPFAYIHTHKHRFDALLNIPLDKIQSRSEAQTLLTAAIPHPGERSYLLSNLVETNAEDGKRFHWSSNIPLLRDKESEILGWPTELNQEVFSGKTWFLAGGSSHRLTDSLTTPSGSETLKKLFPHSILTVYPGVGHFVHVEKPREVTQQLFNFLLHDKP